MKIFFTFLMLFALHAYGQNFLVTDPIPDNGKYLIPPHNFEIPESSVKVNNPKPALEEEIVLDGIFKVNSVFYAILSNELYQKGDKTDKFEVSDIDMKSVTLVRKNKKVVKYVKND